MNSQGLGLRIFLIPIFLLCIMGFTNPFSDTVAKGNDAYNSGKLDKALEYYEQAQKEHPDSPEVSYNIGNVKYRQQNYEDAVADYRQATVTSDETLRQQAYYNIGNALYMQQQYADAAQAYIESLKLNPADQDAKYNLELARRMQEIQEQQNKDSCDNPKESDDGKENKDQQKDQKDQQNQDQKQNQDQEKQNQEQQQQGQQQKDQQQEQQQKEQQAKQDKEKEKEQQQAKQDEEKKDQEEKQAQAAKQGDEKPPEGEEGEQMMLISPEQAAQILDALEQEEQDEQKKQLQAPPTEDHPDKDW